MFPLLSCFRVINLNKLIFKTLKYKNHKQLYKNIDGEYTIKQKSNEHIFNLYAIDFKFFYKKSKNNIFLYKINNFRDKWNRNLKNCKNIKYDELEEDEEISDEVEECMYYNHIISELINIVFEIS